MIKTYKANTNVSINVVLVSKKSLHISFTPLSNGSSTFTTDNEEVMNAIERHYNFGKLFRLINTQGASRKKTAKVEATEVIDKETEETTDAGDNAGQNDETATGNTEDKPILKKVKVSDFAAAKDYLADTFGISRTALRSMKAITEQATAHGIEFEGLV